MQNCWMSCLLMFRCILVWFISKERVEGKTGSSNVWLEHLPPCNRASFLAVCSGNHCPTKAKCACFELAHWCTNHRDAIPSGLLTVQCLRADSTCKSPQQNQRVKTLPWVWGASRGLRSSILHGWAKNEMPDSSLPHLASLLAATPK